MERFFRHIVRNYKGWILFLALLSIGSAWAILTKIESDNSIDIWFLDNDPHYKAYLDFQKKQGSDEVIIALIKAPQNLFDTAFASLLVRAEKKLLQLPYIQKSLSYASAEAPKIVGNKIITSPLYKEGISPERLAKNVRNFPKSTGHLIDSSEQYAALYLQLIPTKELKPYRAQIIRDIKPILDSHFEAYHLSGFPVFNDAINRIVLQEAFKFSLLAIIIISIVLLLLLPDLRYFGLSLTAVIVPVLVTFGGYALLGYQMNSMTIIIPTILMVYSLSDAIHILNTYHHTEATSPNERIVRAFTASFKPCLFTTLTTMVGWLALYFAVMPALKMLGVFSAIGLALAFVLAYIVTGAGLMFLEKNAPRPNRTTGRRFHFDTSPFIRRINWYTSHYQKSILFVFSLLFVFGIWTISKVKIDNDSRKLLADGPFKRDLAFIENTMGGGILFFINLTSTDDKQILAPNKMKAIRDFSNSIQSLNGISSPLSIVDIKDYLVRTSASHVFMRQNISKLLQSSQGNDQNNSVFNIISPGKRRTTVIANVRAMSSTEYMKLHRHIDSVYDKSKLLDNEVKMEVKGYSPLYIKMVDYIYISQLRSFIGAFVVAFLILFYFVRSLRITVLALIPNLFPIVLLAILMFLFDIHLEAGNSIIAPIMLGIAMDDTIHLLYHYQRYRKLGEDITSAMNHAMLFTGKAILTTSIALILGFIIIGLSQVDTLKEFGILCSFAVLFALIADAFLLPTLIKRFGK